MKNLSVLGSTGSIGTQTLEVAQLLGIRINALAAAKNKELLEQQARTFRPKIVALSDKAAAAQLKIALADTDIKVYSGMEGVIEAASCQSDITVAAISGMAGILPTVAAIQAGSDIALANKETMVCVGETVMRMAKEKGVSILPVDSEHSAIFQCLQDQSSAASLRKILLTASGGPFFGKTSEELEKVTIADTLKHPNWSMGQKVTVDSATLMNKGLELIEAMRLFEVSSEKIQILVHRESIVHSMVEFSDGAVIAQLSVPDMRLPIQYALTYPKRAPSLIKPLNFAEIGKLTFYEPDRNAFPCLALAEHAAQQGQEACTILNGANEGAVQKFLEGKIPFCRIADSVQKVVDASLQVDNCSIFDMIELGKEAYKMAYYG